MPSSVILTFSPVVYRVGIELNFQPAKSQASNFSYITYVNRILEPGNTDYKLTASEVPVQLRAEYVDSPQKISVSAHYI